MLWLVYINLKAIIIGVNKPTNPKILTNYSGTTI